MDNTKKELSKEPYKGTRDFYPDDMFLQNYIFSIWKQVAEKYGYSEYGASILEETALYQAKTGSEIVNEQTYSFEDRGGRNVTIRPEMTPTVARMVARKRQELSFPLRWYSIPNMLRYEKPQRGRLREHWQLNVDIFGVDNTHADAEIIAISSDIMLAFGAKPQNFIIKINNRRLINYLFQDYLKVNSETAYTLSKLIDKKDKMPRDSFIRDLTALLAEKAQETLSILELADLTNLPQDIKDNQGFQDLTNLAEQLKQKGIENFKFDLSLVRGFDYYTGNVFEVIDTNPINSRSLFGGGRYDDLVGIFDVEKVPGVGFGMGDVTIRDFLETYNLLPTYISQTDLYICTLEKSNIEFAQNLATYLRSQGLKVSIDYTGRRLASQIKTAEKQFIPFIVCIGEDEVRDKVFKLKNLTLRQEQTLSWEELPGAIKRTV